MHINIPEYKLSIIVPHKSGNTIIYSTIVEILELNSIEFNNTSNNDELEENCFLFVRNPIDRFFSSYNWYAKLKRLFDVDRLDSLTADQLSLMGESLKIFGDLEIDSLQKFIEKYRIFINNSTDTHFLPQSSFFLKRNGDKGMRANLNLNIRKEYDARFENRNYKFFRVEDISDTIKLNKSLLMSRGITNFGIYKKDNVSKVDLKTFPFLKDFPKNTDHLFMVFHAYFNDFLSEYHHSKNPNYYYNEITVNDYIKVYNMFKKECIFFGYDDEPNLNNIEFKRNTI
jgi:hypothetical protein